MLFAAEPLLQCVHCRTGGLEVLFAAEPLLQRVHCRTDGVSGDRHHFSFQWITISICRSHRMRPLPSGKGRIPLTVHPGYAWHWSPALGLVGSLTRRGVYSRVSGDRHHFSFQWITISICHRHRMRQLPSEKRRIPLAVHLGCAWALESSPWAGRVAHTPRRVFQN
jgi:hypothetical protein